MSNINEIKVLVKTRSDSYAGTDSWIYLGLAGREFCLDTTGDDFERGKKDEFVLGRGATVVNDKENDPRDPQLNKQDVKDFPAYIRFESSGSSPGWKPETITVTVRYSSDPKDSYINDLGAKGNLWLQNECGKCLFLRKI